MKVKEKMLPQREANNVSFQNSTWQVGLSCVASTLYIHDNNLYLCTSSHIAGETFDEMKFTIASKGIGLSINTIDVTVSEGTDSRTVACNSMRAPHVVKLDVDKWRPSTLGTDYTYEYDNAIENLTVNLLANGQYKINY